MRNAYTHRIAGPAALTGCLLALLGPAFLPSARSQAAPAASSPATLPSAALDAKTFDALNSPPPGFEGATVAYKPDARVPLDLAFVDEAGRPVKLADYFHGKPVLLTMVYYQCPMLCGLTLHGIVEATRGQSLAPGKDYEVVAVSFNPAEKPALAAVQKAKYVEALADSAAAAGWHFLTTPEDAPARALGDAIGFGYKYISENGQFFHESAIYVCTPDGRVSRMIPGPGFDSEVVRDSLVNASEGKLGSRIFRIAQACGIFHYDTATGKYVTVAKNVMRLGGLLTMLVLGAMLGMFWYHEVRKARTSPSPGSPPASPTSPSSS